MDVDDIKSFYEESFVADMHIHSHTMLPFPFKQIYQFQHRKTLPPYIKFNQLKAAGVDCAVACAVGDKLVTKCYLFKNNYSAAITQLKKIISEINETEGKIVVSADEIEKYNKEGKVAFLLGIEGGDFLQGDIQNLKKVYDMGVRVICLIHYSKNDIGTPCAEWGHSDEKSKENEFSGLTNFGVEVVKEMNKLGMLIDVAHASKQVTLDIAKVTKKPIISSHTGVKALHDFLRYLSDEEIEAIAKTGGCIGLWPFRHERSAKNISELVEQAKYIADLVGVEHVGIGTDMNGVPQTIEGYNSEFDLPKIAEALFEVGFSESDVRKILGENFLHLLHEILI